MRNTRLLSSQIANLAETRPDKSTNIIIEATYIETVRAAAKPTSIAAEMSFCKANRMASTRSGMPGAQDKKETEENEVVKPNRIRVSGIDSATCDNA
jgi:hypothetical protein